jgi:hypothetical protein
MRASTIAVLAALVLVPTASASHPLQTGVYLGWHGADDAQSYARAQAAGTTVVRISVRWNEVAPSARPTGFNARDPDDPAYDWAAADAQIMLAETNHLRPMVTVFAPPKWAMVGPRGQRVSAADFADFGTAIATRYDGGHGLPLVSAWEAWNEPNVNEYLTPQFISGHDASPAAYRQLLNAFAAAVHAVRRSDVVVAGALSPFSVIRGATVTIGPLRFMRELLCVSAGPHPHATCKSKVQFDAWSHHPYTSGGPTHQALNPDDVSLGDLPEMRAVLDAAYRAGHIVSTHRPQFWVTEFSWDSKPPDPLGVPLALHARWTAEALYRMWQNGVSVVIWLQLYDDDFTPSNPEQAGLYFRRGGNNATAKPKPALRAFTFPFVAYLGQGRATVWARTPGGKRQTVIVEQRKGAKWHRVAALRSDAFGIVQGQVRGNFTAADWLRARVATTSSLAFSLRVPPDRRVNPFGT